MNIAKIISFCTDENIEVTDHILRRLQTRKIKYSELKEAICNGEIIEDYPDDYPFPSCLILGKTIRERWLHVVVGLSDRKLWFITAYEPDPEKWSEDFRERRK